MSYLKVNSGGVRNNNLKRILHILFILIIYSILITSSTYAYLYLENTSNSITGTGKCEGVNYKGENINASNLVSTTNYLEGAKSTITLSQNKDCMIYNYVNLYLYTNDTTTAPITTVKALKYKIVSSNNITYSGVVSYMEDTLLATLPLEEKEINYTVYLYIDSIISLGNYNDKTYSGYLYASTEQTSTIGKEDNSKNNLGLQTIDFDYLGDEQNFITPKTGNYQLETWGAQGGSYDETHYGGYGGYSIGIISLTSFEKLYLNVGGTTANDVGGYNGGGNGDNIIASNNIDGENKYLGGGGATHIAKKPGLLNLLENYKQNILVVSGGGGGLYFYNLNHVSIGGHGGGYLGGNGNVAYSSCNEHPPTSSQGGTQSSGGLGNNLFANFSGTFGKGGNGATGQSLGTGGGGGYYGGGGTLNMGCSSESGGGGSGYIGNTLLTNKSMYCYNCEESTETSTKTISTTNVSENPISKYAKKGNGYARITIIN